MVHLTDHMEGRTCCLLAVCAHFVQRKVILAYCGHTAAHGSNMPQVFRRCLDAVPSAWPCTDPLDKRAQPTENPPVLRHEGRRAINQHDSQGICLILL